MTSRRKKQAIPEIKEDIRNLKTSQEQVTDRVEGCESSVGQLKDKVDRFEEKTNSIHESIFTVVKDHVVEQTNGLFGRGILSYSASLREMIRHINSYLNY